MRPPLHAALALLAWGCAPPGEPTDGAGDVEDTAAMVYSTDVPEPAFTAEEMGVELQEVMALGAPSLVTICETYASIMAEGTEDCPGLSTDLGTMPEGCDTEDGFHFAGIGWYNWASVVNMGGHDVAMAFSHGGDYEILRPDGTRMAGAGGTAFLGTLQEGMISTSVIDVHGSWMATYRDDWLARGFSGVFEASLTTDLVDYYDFQISGGIGIGNTNLYLEDATWDPNDGCGGMFKGALSLRDDRGFWTRWEITDDCSTCGQVVFHQDQELGELCLDINEWGHELSRTTGPPIVDGAVVPIQSQ